MKQALIVSLVSVVFALPLAVVAETKSASKSVYEKRLEACRIVAGDVQAEPALNDGKLIGFRYTQIRPGSAYSRAGFKAGDILIEQNGIKLQDPTDIVKAFEAAKDGEPQISTVLRAGKPIKFKMACPKTSK